MEMSIIEESKNKILFKIDGAGHTICNILKDELKNNLGSKIQWDVVTLQLYSTAACFYEISPLAVVLPSNLSL